LEGSAEKAILQKYADDFKTRVVVFD